MTGLYLSCVLIRANLRQKYEPPSRLQLGIDLDRICTFRFCPLPWSIVKQVYTFCLSTKQLPVFPRYDQRQKSKTTSTTGKKTG